MTLPRNRSRIQLLFIGLSLVAIGIVLLFTMISFLYLIPTAVGIILFLVGLVSLFQRKATKALPLKIYLAIAFTALLGPCLYHVYWVNIGSRGPDIRFVVPHGFSGQIKITVDPKGGTELARIGNEKKIVLPENGILRIKENPFEKSHRESAVYDNGAALPMGYPTPTYPGETAFYSLGATSKTDERGKQETYYDFFVGKKEELEKLRGW